MDYLCFLRLMFLMLYWVFIAALWSPAGEGLNSWLFFCDVDCIFVTFQCGILGQVWYLVVLFRDLCHFSYLHIHNKKLKV